MHRRLRSLALALSALGAVAGTAEAATYKVGTGWGCTHPTLAQAVAAANQDPSTGEHVIRLTRGASHWNTHAVATGLLVIEGGYDSCLAPLPGGKSTLVGNASGQPTIDIIGPALPGGAPSRVTLKRLDLVRARGAESGGAVRIAGGVAFVHLVDVDIHENQAVDGGAIAVHGLTTSGAPPTTLYLERTLIYANRAVHPAGGDARGGGIACFNATIDFHAGTAVADNEATTGGGLYLDNCSLRTFTYGQAVGVYSNRARGSGGGIYASGSRLTFDSHVAGGLWVAMNEAHIGGGISLHRSSLDGRDVILTHNRARSSGGGLAAESGSSVKLSSLTSCPGVRCTTLEGNSSPGKGDAAWVNGSVLEIKNGRLVSNGRAADPRSEASLLVEGTNSRVRLDQVLARLNRSRALLALGSRASGHVWTTTTQGNDVEAVFQADRAAVQVSRTIVGEQAPTRTLRLIGTGTASFLYVLTHEAASLPDPQSVAVGDPLFVNPAAGDLHLQSASPAVDFATAWPGPDLDGLPRPIDLGAPNRYGPCDLGVYERQTD